LPVRKYHALGELLAFAALVRNEQLVREWLQALAAEWNNTGAARERERMMAQYKAMSDRWENWRKSLNKSQNWQNKPPEFDKLYNDVQELKKKLEIR